MIECECVCGPTGRVWTDDSSILHVVAVVKVSASTLQQSTLVARAEEVVQENAASSLAKVSATKGKSRAWTCQSS